MPSRARTTASSMRSFGNISRTLLSNETKVTCESIYKCSKEEVGGSGCRSRFKSKEPSAKRTVATTRSNTQSEDPLRFRGKPTLLFLPQVAGCCGKADLLAQ